MLGTHLASPARSTLVGPAPAGDSFLPVFGVCTPSLSSIYRTLPKACLDDIWHTHIHTYIQVVQARDPDGHGRNHSSLMASWSVFFWRSHWSDCENKRMQPTSREENLSLVGYIFMRWFTYEFLIADWKWCITFKSCSLWRVGWEPVESYCVALMLLHSGSVMAGYTLSALVTKHKKTLC